jgi:competence protein ComEC
VIELTLAFLGGILAAHFGAGLAALATTTAAFAILRRKAQKRYVTAFIALLLGVIDASLQTQPANEPDRHYQTFAAVILERGEADDGRSSLVVALPDGTHARLTLSEAPEPIGERLTLRAKREPFDEARNPGEPAERDIEAERGVTWRLVHPRVIARLPPDERDPRLWLPRLRAWGSARIHALLGEPDATILAGAMWGERGALPPDLRDEFQDTGTVHVLVTAGLHLGVIAALALGVFSLLRLGRVTSSLAAIPIVWLYAELSGAHLPSMRAATMLTFALVARASGREAFSWNGLALAAIVVAAIRPGAVASLSFALSFSCVAAIFAFARPIAQWFEERGAHHGLASLAGVALATQCGTWPLTAYGFLVIAPYAPLANAAVVPVVGIAMLVGFAALLASPIPPLAHAIANVAISLVDWIATVVRCVAQLPGAHIIATPPPVWAIALYDAALAFCAWSLARGAFRRRAFAAVAIASALCLWPPHPPSDKLVVTAIDVGQADSVLIETPRGHAFLVDGGGRLENGAASPNATSRAEDVGVRTVVPFLIRHGIHHLDAVLLTHPHGDHAGGIGPVLRTLGADGFADSGQTYPGHAYNDALGVARAKHIAMLEPRAGDVWRTDDGVTFRFYGPALPYISGGTNDINDNSLVFRMEYRSFRMLFTGDAGEAAERRMLARGDDLRADVLKVGHHGSAYGSTPDFVRAVSPRLAVISVGRHNLFGHPAPSTIATLERSGARVLRTDRDGAVTIESDGRDFSATTFAGPP